MQKSTRRVNGHDTVQVWQISKSCLFDRICWEFYLHFPCNVEKHLIKCESLVKLVALNQQFEKSSKNKSD